MKNPIAFYILKLTTKCLPWINLKYLCETWIFRDDASFFDASFKSRSCMIYDIKSTERNYLFKQFVFVLSSYKLYSKDNSKNIHVTVVISEKCNHWFLLT